jgi:hypothetical protein
MGGAVGLVAGGVVGAESVDAVRDRARGSLYGLAIGGVAGLLLQQAVRQYAWNDALLVAAYGAAVGAAPWGVLIGTGAGTVVGALAWAVSPRGGWPDVILFGVVGGAVGGLADWVHGAVEGQRGGGNVPLTFSFTVG